MQQLGMAQVRGIDKHPVEAIIDLLTPVLRRSLRVRVLRSKSEGLDMGRGQCPHL